MIQILLGSEETNQSQCSSSQRFADERFANASAKICALRQLRKLALMNETRMDQPPAEIQAKTDLNSQHTL